MRPQVESCSHLISPTRRGVAEYISGLPVASTFVILSFFYTNLMEYYVPRVEDGSLVLPIYLPEDFRAPFVDPRHGDWSGCAGNHQQAGEV